MTISSTIRKAGPFIGNDSASTFPFTFKVFDAAEVEVVRLEVATTIETILSLTTDYTVSLNQDQDSNPGGSITLVAGPLATGFNLVVTSDLANLQPTDLTNQGVFYPKVINDALDRATIQIQQLEEKIDRSAKLPITSAEDADSLVADIVRVASISTDVTNVAAIDDDVSAVAAIDSEIVIAANNVADITNFADVYQGPSATPPALRNDGSALQLGDLYFNTALDEMNVYTSTGWVVAYIPTAGFLAAANNLSDLNNAATARTNLGLSDLGDLT